MTSGKGEIERQWAAREDGRVMCRFCELWTQSMEDEGDVTCKSLLGGDWCACQIGIHSRQIAKVTEVCGTMTGHFDALKDGNSVSLQRGNVAAAQAEEFLQCHVSP
jgi:hypothetical protein